MAAVASLDFTLRMARLSASASIWVKHTVGGILYLARVAHDPTGDFHVGTWQKLPGGWEHLPVFYYDAGSTEVSYLSAIKITALDADRALLTFALYGTTNYAMVVAAGADGTITSGEPVTFSAGWSNASTELGAGSLSDGDSIFTIGPGRAVALYRENYFTGSEWTLRAHFSLITASGLAVSVAAGGPVATPTGFALWRDGEGDGWWGWWNRVDSGRMYTEAAWFRVVGGAAVAGPVVELADVVYASNKNHYLSVSRASDPGMFLVSWFPVFTGSFGVQNAGALTFVLVRLAGDTPTVEGTYSGGSVPTKGGQSNWPHPIQAMTKRHLVHMYLYNGVDVTNREFRQFVFGGSAYEVANQATYSMPPDANVSGGTDARMWRVAASRAMALHSRVETDPVLHGSGSYLWAGFRLLTMAVPPVCPPRFAGDTSGLPAARVSEATAVVRMAPAGAITPPISRDPCGAPVSELARRGPTRVYRVGTRS